MTSKSLYFKLLGEDLKRRTWAIALGMIGFFFALPINLALTMEDAQAKNFFVYNNYVSLDEMNWLSEADKAAKILELKTKVVLQSMEFGNGLLAFLMIITAVVMGVSSFSYLHNRRKVDFYHSLPIRRELMYLVQYTGGILIIGAVYLLNLLFLVGVSCAYQVPLADILGAAAAGWLLNMLYFLLLYGVTVAAVMLTGQLIVGLLAVGVLFFFLPALVLVLESYCEIFFATMPSGWQENGWMTGTLKWISPFSAYLSALGWGAAEVGSHIPAVIITCFVVLALWLFGMELYRKRPLESAGRAMAFRITSAPIRFVMVWGFGVMGSLFFWVIQNRPYWAIFGALMGCLISHCVIEVIYHFDFKKLFAHWPQMILAAVLSLAVFFSFRFDWWGYDSYMPKANKIQSVSVAMDMDWIWLNNRKIEKDKAGNESLVWQEGDKYRMEHMEIKEIQPVLTLVQEGIRQEKESKDERFNQWRQTEDAPLENRQNDTWVTMEVSYRMNGDRIISRRYSFGLSDQMVKVYGELYGQKEYKEGLYPVFSQSPENMAWASYEENGSLQGLITDQAKIKSLLEAYRADLLDLTVETRQQENPIGKLMFADQEQKQFLDEYSAVQKAEAAGSRDTYTPYDVCQSWPVYPSFERTISLLREQGVPAGEGIDPNQAESITAEIYGNEERTLEEYQAVNPRFLSTDRLVFQDPAEIKLLLSAFSEDGMYSYNGLCGVENFSLYVQTKDGATIYGVLQENRVTPEIEKLFEGTGLFAE